MALFSQVAGVWKVVEQKTLSYRENLEERLIACLAERNGISLEKAMDIYYSSALAEQIHQGIEGIQYLDHKVLAQILRENEPDRFQ